MKPEDARQVAQTMSVAEVNQFLAKGFRIIKILSAKKEVDGCEIVGPEYVLGLPQNAQKPKR